MTPMHMARIMKMVMAASTVLGGLVCQGLALTPTHHLVNNMGGHMSAASYSTYSAGAQGHPVGVIADTEDIWSKTIYNFTGFIQPDDIDLLEDTDGDGIADVVDPDMDGDGLSNIDELFGSWFGGVATDPKRGDTSGNGTSDYEHWMTGTNPTDPESQLRITEVIYNSPTDVRIRFRSVGGRQYELSRSTTLEGLLDAPSIDGIEGVPGQGPFNEGITEFIDVPFGEDYYYRVRLVP